MLIAFFRSILLYLVLILIIRLMGKRQVGQMEPSEFVVTMLMANLASIPMENTDEPIFTGLIPMATVLGLELLLSVMSLASVQFRRILCGKPVILIDNGKILRENLRRTRVTLDELTELIREKGELSPETVQFAVLETNGNLSVFPYPKHRPATASEAGIQAKSQSIPYTIIADGCLYRENLTLCGKSEAWLEKILRQRGATVKDTWLLMVDDKDHCLFLSKAQA